MALQTATFATTSSNLSTYTKLDATSSIANKGDQVARFFAKANQSSGSATLQVVFKNLQTDLVIASFKATCTPLARREALDNASGDFICSVVFDESGTSKLDLLGLITKKAGDSEVVEVLFGVTAMTTVTALDVTVLVSKLI